MRVVIEDVKPAFDRLWEWAGNSLPGAQAGPVFCPQQLCRERSLRTWGMVAGEVPLLGPDNVWLEEPYMEGMELRVIEHQAACDGLVAQLRRVSRTAKPDDPREVTERRVHLAVYRKDGPGLHFMRATEELTLKPNYVRGTYDTVSLHPAVNPEAVSHILHHIKEGALQSRNRLAHLTT